MRLMVLAISISSSIALPTVVMDVAHELWIMKGLIGFQRASPQGQMKFVLQDEETYAFMSLFDQVDDLEEVSEYYRCFNEIISLMDSGLVLERAHMGIFTELGVLYARYRYENLMEHILLFSTRLNIPKLI